MRFFGFGFRGVAVCLLLLYTLLVSGNVTLAQTPTYTSDPNIADFTGAVRSYATLTNFNNTDGNVEGDLFTPTSLELSTTQFRVYNLPPFTPITGLPNTSNWILATFNFPVSSITVFPNIDHFGSAYDGYQYSIAGSNDGQSWVMLYDTLTVISSDTENGEPFTIGTFSGTPPTTVNNVLTPGSTPGGFGVVGYIATFNFGTPYKYYAFGTSTEGAGNPEQELSAVGTGSSQTVNVQFTPSNTPETQIGTIGNPSDPAAHSLALTLASVTNAINVSITFFYEPTDLSTGMSGIGIADGDCELGATEDTDFDCRLTPDFAYPNHGLPPGDQLVPHIIPSHNNLGVWVRVIATRVSDGLPAVAGTDYAALVSWYYAWNCNPPLVGSSDPSTCPPAQGPPNPAYQAGWNNMNPQMYDRPGANPDIAFVANITTFSKNCAETTCVGTNDPGTGGKTKTLNDIMIGAPPNPPTGTPSDTVELLLPAPGISPFRYLKGLPMLVAFELEKGSTETPDPTALTSPHSVNVATLDPTGANIPVQYPAGAPTTFTYNPFFKTYFIFLSPAAYKTDGTVYTLQINSDLFPAPVTAKFVVKKF
jgi:hypothetical protein